MKARLLTFVLLFFLLNSSFAWAVPWSEVTRFTGSVDYMTNHFICTHAEWRIDWNYEPNASDPRDPVFVMYIFQSNETGSIGAVTQYGNTTTNGTTYVHDRPGEFYLRFLVQNVESYTAIIEQDMGAVPEFSPMILTLMFATGIVVAMTLARRQGHLRSRGQR